MNTQRQNKFVAVIRKILDGQPVQMPGYFTPNEKQLFRETQGLREQFVEAHRKIHCPDDPGTISRTVFGMSLRAAHLLYMKEMAEKEFTQAVALDDIKRRLAVKKQARQPSRSSRSTRRLPQRKTSRRR